MIKIINEINDEPYAKFYELYDLAFKNNQNNIEAIVISSFDNELNEVNSRIVNLKYIKNNEWIFFSNYNSPKASEFIMHNQISCILYWNKLNIQIRMKAIICKTPKDFSDKHFSLRSNEKNALAISSSQSSYITSYEEVCRNYEQILSNLDQIKRRPDYWGGFSFVPYYFEFWEGHSSRLNKRQVFENNNGNWNNYIIQP